MRLSLASLLFTVALSAQQPIVCVGSSNGSMIYTADYSRCMKDTRPGEAGFLRMHGFRCEAVAGLPNCTPPSTMTYRMAPSLFLEGPSPFTAPVRYDGEVKVKGETLWRWRLVNAVTCNAKARVYEPRLCSARAGDVAYLTPRFFRTGQDGRGVE